MARRKLFIQSCTPVVFTVTTGLTVGVDSSVGSHGGVGLTTSPFTVGTPASLTHGALILVVTQLDGASRLTGLGADWDDGQVVGPKQAMTLLGTTTSANTGVNILGLRNPNLNGGNLTLRVNWTNASQVGIVVYLLTNVEQSSDGAAFINYTSGTNNQAPIAVSVTTTSGGKVFAGYVSAANFASSTGTSFIDNTGNTWAAAYSYDNGTGGPVSLSGSPGSATTSACAGVNVVAG